MDMPRNTFKHAIAEGKLQIGLWCSLCSNIAAEIVSRLPASTGSARYRAFAQRSARRARRSFRPCRRHRDAAIVRPAWNDTVLIKRYLDIGAQTLLVPYVQNAEEAQRAVEATRYPPRGMRGVAGASRASRYGRVTDYLKKADAEICVLVQVETQERARRSSRRSRRSTASTACSSGRPICPPRSAISAIPAMPSVQKAIQDAVTRLKKLGKPAGILTGNEEEISRYIEWGYIFVAVGADVGLLARAPMRWRRSTRAECDWVPRTLFRT